MVFRDDTRRFSFWGHRLGADIDPWGSGGQSEGKVVETKIVERPKVHTR